MSERAPSELRYTLTPENARRVADGTMTWSPDGTMIAYYSTRGGGYDIWVTDGIVAGERSSHGGMKALFR